MRNRQQQILTDATQRLLRRGATANIQKILAKTHPADVAAVFQSLVPRDQRHLFDLIKENATKGEVLSELDPEQAVPLLQHYDVNELLPILTTMSTDDVADLLNNLPEELSDAILDRMKRGESEELHDLMRYPEDSAGGIMSPDFFALHADTSAEEAIQALRESKGDVEMAFYIYVIDETGVLLGVVSLRQLVTVPPQTRLRQIMEDDVVSVRPEVDQEEVARITARYNFLAIPVVDENNKILGIVTVDDVIDVLREEATEDFLKMAGAGPEMVETRSVFRNVRARFPWLVASCLGGVLAAFVMSQFSDQLSLHHTLALFIPVVLGMGGNIGTQSSTIIVRGLATGHVQAGQSLRTIGREVAVGLMMGVIYGSVVGAIAGGFGAALFYGLVVGCALMCSMFIAALVGSSIPLLFERLHIDPAVATGPFVTTAVDVLGTLAYFSLAVLFSVVFPTHV